MKTLVKMVTVFAVIFAIAACSSDGGGSNAPTNIVIKQGNTTVSEGIILEIGTPVTLTVSAKDAADYSWALDSAAEDLMTIEGKDTATLTITPTAKGKGHITAYAYNDKGTIDKKIVVDVFDEIPVGGLLEVLKGDDEIDYAAGISMEVGGHLHLTALVYPLDAVVTWQSEKTNIVTVSNGNLNAVAVGSSEITVNAKKASEDIDITKKFTVTVTAAVFEPYVIWEWKQDVNAWANLVNGGSNTNEFYATGYPAVTVRAIGTAVNADPAGGILVTANSRLTIGQLRNITTTSAIAGNGDFDLSVKTRVTFKYKNITSGDSAAYFRLYLNNNTTGDANSLHAAQSQIFTTANLNAFTAGTITSNHDVEITHDNVTGTGTAVIIIDPSLITTQSQQLKKAFLSLVMQNSGTPSITVTEIKIEYIEKMPDPPAAGIIWEWVSSGTGSTAWPTQIATGAATETGGTPARFYATGVTGAVGYQSMVAEAKYVYIPVKTFGSAVFADTDASFPGAIRLGANASARVGANPRLAIGQKNNYPTTSTDTVSSVGGVLDLFSKKTKVTINYADIEETTDATPAFNFRFSVNNNQTTAGNSSLGAASQIKNYATLTAFLADAETGATKDSGTIIFTIDPATFTTNKEALRNGTINMYTNTGSAMTITGIKIEYID